MAGKIALVPAVCLLVLVLRAAAANAVASVHTAAGAAGAALPAKLALGGASLPFTLPLPFTFPLPGGGSDAADGCLKAVREAEGCAADVLRSLASPPGAGDGDGGPGVGAACCGALRGVGESCFRGVLPVSPIRALFGPLVRHACGLVSGPGPRV
ncbi:hypothetical protein ACP4OV_018203 [Aristida adscensionis]